MADRSDSAAAGTPTPDQEVMAGWMRGYMFTQVLGATARLGIAEAVGRDRPTRDDLIATLGLDQRAATSFLSLLIAMNVVEEEQDGRLGLTARGAELYPPDGNLRGQVLLAASEYYRAWEFLDHTLCTGDSGFERARGRTLWETVDDQDGLARSFGAAMRRNTSRLVDELMGFCDLEGVTTLADVGGGDGSLAAGFVAATPGMTGVVVDRPAMIDVARTSPAAVALGTRLDFVAADILQQLPVRADLFVLKSVLHNWPDATARTILRTCVASMVAGNRLCIVEKVRGRWGDRDVRACLRDLDMHVLFGSGDRTAEDYRCLAEDAGLRVRSVAEGSESLCVLTCELAG